MFGRKVSRVIVNQCYERHKEIRSLDIHCVVWSIRRTMKTHRAPGEHKSCCSIFSGNFWLTDSSVGIAGGSGIESRWGQDFPPVQTSPGAHPSSCTMGTGYFPEVEALWDFNSRADGETETSYTHGSNS